MSLRRIVATGGHSGLGLACLESLLSNPPSSLPPPYHIILCLRDPASNHVKQAQNKLSQLLQALPGNSLLETRKLDLASIHSVTTLARDLVREMESKDERIDVVLMNAAVAKATKRMVPTQDITVPADILRDEQGRFEETALVNHVAPLLFVNLLRPRLVSQPRLPTGSTQIPTRIVFTGSALHRKADLATLDQAFSPASSSSKDFTWSLRTTYAASKLLLYIGVQRLADLLEDDMNERKVDTPIEVVIVQPGFVPSTGLNRETSTSLRLIMSWVFPILPFSFITSLKEGGETISAAISKPLSVFPAASPDDSTQGRSTFPAEGKWAPPHIKSKDTEGPVQRALIVRGRKLETPDKRTFDLDLMKKWWPKVCDQA